MSSNKNEEDEIKNAIQGNKNLALYFDNFDFIEQPESISNAYYEEKYNGFFKDSTCLSKVLSGVVKTN